MSETNAAPAARIVARRLVGKRLPPASFDRYKAPPLTLRELGDHLAIYFYPGCVCSPEDGYESPKRDAATRRAFIYRSADLEKLGFTPVVHAVYPIHRIGLSTWDVVSWLRNDGNPYTSDA
jgi:hypothetical protein